MAADKTANRFATSSNARLLHVADVPVHEIQERLTSALEAEGFDIVADIDLGQLLSRRLDESREPLFIVEACHPKLTQLALAVADDGSLLMPLRFCVWKEGTGSTIGTLPPARLVEALGLPHLDEVVFEAEARIDRVFGHLDVSVPSACEIPGVQGLRGAREVSLDNQELATLREAARRQTEALMAEVAGTESRSLQHELAQTIDRLEALTRKLKIVEMGGGASAHA